jgi:hypothetical protein
MLIESSRLSSSASAQAIAHAIASRFIVFLFDRSTLRHDASFP